MAGICSIPPHGRKNHNSLYRECIGETPAPPAAKATDSDCRAGGIPADPGRISEDLQAGARRAALKEAHSRGISTWVSLEPVIDHVQTLALIEATHEFVGHYGVGKINHKPGIEKNIDWPKFRADAEALLKKYGKSYQIKEDLLKATPTLAKVRILKPDGYRSQFPNGPNKWIDRLCACGEVIEVDLQRAEELIKRGVAVAVEAEA